MSLPHQRAQLFLLTGSLETTLLYEAGISFPSFASFTLIRRPEALTPMKEFYRAGALLAKDLHCGIVFSTPTWRASEDWGRQLGYSQKDLFDANQEAVRFVQEIRCEESLRGGDIVVSGCMGPRGDGYIVGQKMTIQEAEDYHRKQVEAFAGTTVDMLSAMTLNYSQEAIGIVLAAQSSHLPVVVSFTLETTGLLPSGESLASAILATDQATGAYPVYYMVNCSHPSHFAHVFDTDAQWVQRVRGLQVNASAKSHAELTASTDLDAGDPTALAEEMHTLKTRLPHMCAMGGCCGTDFRHIRLIAERCLPLFP